MTRLLLGLGVLLAPALGAGLAKADEEAELRLPAAPPDHVLDEARLLDKSTRETLQAEILRLNREVGVDLYIAAYTLLPESIEDRARRLRELWATGHRTVVMVYRRGAQQLTFSASGNGEVFIPSQRLFAIYDDAVTAARRHEEPRDRLIAATRSLADALIRELQVRDAKRGPFVSGVFGLLFGLLIASLTIGAISYAVVRRLNRRRDERDAGVVFPEVVVGRRLGAAFGGGTVTEIEFPKPPSTVREQAGAAPRPPA